MFDFQRLDSTRPFVFGVRKSNSEVSDVSRFGHFFFSPDHYVHVPVPSPPHVVTKYHTQWNTVVDHASDTYEAWFFRMPKEGWSENRLPMGVPIFSIYGKR